MISKTSSTTLFLVSVLAFACSPSAFPDSVEVGEVVSYDFKTPPLNGQGVGSLEDLRGKPVFVEFWGHR